MDKGLVIGLIGAAVTLSAYSQTMVSDTYCIMIGFLILMFGLLVREGFIPFYCEFVTKAWNENMSVSAERKAFGAGA
ncbi:hypothetical protein BVC80_9097g36 [Macleaya cordata]|uniref:Uncharacterized protein n=1 Tax=Macleaya cordata TaxID=56857 RepID=A0A200QEY1_MACCD|nr:hypothetical protein BVC80_9097g36 [Macleaya cordata]